MAEVRPFKAYRPQNQRTLEVAAPPYDVVTTEQARRLAQGKPFSLLHVTRPEIDLPPDTDPYSEQVYQKARENLQRMLKEGVIIQDQNEAFYIYRQQMGDHSQVGVVGLCSVAEYEKGLIKIHEHTRKKKEDDRTRHVEAHQGNVEPVFLMYRSVDDIVDFLTGLQHELEPVTDIVTPDQVRQILWRVDAPPLVSRIQDLFSQVPALYVADGHHRTAANVRFAQQMRERAGEGGSDKPWEYFMAVILPHDQLRILGYHRVVRDLAGLTEEAFLERVGEKFIVTPGQGDGPERPRVFGMYLASRWYELQPKDGTYPQDDPVLGLDCSILQNNLLAPVLGIEDPRSDRRIDFVGGLKGIETLERLCDSGQYKVAFAMHPTRVEQVMDVADAGLVMPPKSTWFEPKLKSGLFLRLF